MNVRNRFLFIVVVRIVRSHAGDSDIIFNARANDLKPILFVAVKT